VAYSLLTPCNCFNARNSQTKAQGPMSLSCFFGYELKPDGAAFTPVMPSMSSLVITQACVTSAFPTGNAVTLYVQSHKMPTKIAVSTLCPDKDLYHCPLQLIFSSQVSFFLEPSKEGATSEEGKAPVFPHVHISGYYEREDLDGADDDESSSDEEDEFVRTGAGKKAGSAKKAVKKAGKKGDKKDTVKKRGRQ
jgi:hypothetical protein